MARRLLFVCGRNLQRSPTAEKIFHGVRGIEACSAGVNPDSEEPLSAELIEWAEVIFVMEPSHRAKMNRRFAGPLRGKRVVCLGIADEYEFMDPQLIRLLWERVPRSVPELADSTPAEPDPG